ncbi:MAG: hypothetical protein ABIH92_00185 [Nanoarchaeota archaeon]
MYQSYGKFYKEVSLSKIIMADSKTKKVWYKRWWAITLFIFFGLIILGSLFGDDSSTSNNSISQQDNTQNNIAQSDQTLMKGIGISRSYLIDIFENPDLGYSFEMGAPVEGQPNYVGSNEVGSIQLIGPEEELTEAAILIALGSDTGSNTLALVNLLGFANVIDSNSKDWVQQQFEIITDNPIRDYENSKIIGARVFRISYSPIEGLGTLMTLTVEPA